MYSAAELYKNWIYPYQKSIFEYYLGHKIGSKLIKSPLREDRKPTCGFYYSKNVLKFHDFATEEHLDCVQFVRELFKETEHDALKRISVDKGHFKSDRIIVENKKLEFEYIPDDVSNTDYFSAYGIKTNTLLKYGVFYARTVYLNRNLYGRSTKTNPIFVYQQPTGHIKIYRPKSRVEEEKWGGNCDYTDVFGYKQLPYKGQIVFITSSLKDVMVLHELGYNSIAFNGEGYGITGASSAVMEKIIKDLKKRFKYVLFFMDNDLPGRTYSLKLRKTHKIDYVLPQKQKDISDYVKKYSVYNGKRIMKKILSKHFKVQDVF